jgi:hypothetical protein
MIPLEHNTDFPGAQGTAGPPLTRATQLGAHFGAQRLQLPLSSRLQLLHQWEVAIGSPRVHRTMTRSPGLGSGPEQATAERTAQLLAQHFFLVKETDGYRTGNG